MVWLQALTGIGPLASGTVLGLGARHVPVKPRVAHRRGGSELKRASSIAIRVLARPDAECSDRFYEPVLRFCQHEAATGCRVMRRERDTFCTLLHGMGVDPLLSARKWGFGIQSSLAKVRL